MKLKTARVEAGLTLMDVANKIGKSASVISDYENGKVMPGFNVMQTMAELYKVSLDDIDLKGDR